MYLLYMSGLLTTVSSLRQNFFTCLPAIAGKEAFAVLEKTGGLSSRRVGAESPGAWLPAATMGGGRHYPLGVGRVAFCSVKVLISLLDSLGQTYPAGSTAESQPVKHKQGG